MFYKQNIFLILSPSPAPTEMTNMIRDAWSDSHQTRRRYYWPFYTFASLLRCCIHNFFSSFSCGSPIPITAPRCLLLNPHWTAALIPFLRMIFGSIFTPVSWRRLKMNWGKILRAYQVLCTISLKPSSFKSMDALTLNIFVHFLPY